MHARLVLLHRRPARGQRNNPPLTDGTRKVTGRPPRPGCAGRQRRQRAAPGLSSEKNASCGEGTLGILLKRLSRLEETTSRFAETTSPFEKTTSCFAETISLFEKTTNGLEKTTSPFWKTISPFW